MLRRLKMNLSLVYLKLSFMAFSTGKDTDKDLILFSPAFLGTVLKINICFMSHNFLFSIDIILHCRTTSLRINFIFQYLNCKIFSFIFLKFVFKFSYFYLLNSVVNTWNSIFNFNFRPGWATKSSSSMKNYLLRTFMWYLFGSTKGKGHISQHNKYSLSSHYSFSKIKKKNQRNVICESTYPSSSIFKEVFAEIHSIHMSLWRREWQPTPVFLLGESGGKRSLMSCRLWGCIELDMTEAT